VLLGRFHVHGMGAGYDVWVIPGELDRLGQALSSRGLRGPVALVCDEHIGPLYADRVLDSLRSAEFRLTQLISRREQHKNIQRCKCFGKASCRPV
jgi:3-dehydroquinate synthetase